MTDDDQRSAEDHLRSEFRALEPADAARVVLAFAIADEVDLERRYAQTNMREAAADLVRAERRAAGDLASSRRRRTTEVLITALIAGLPGNVAHEFVTALEHAPALLVTASRFFSAALTVPMSAMRWRWSSGPVRTSSDTHRDASARARRQLQIEQIVDDAVEPEIALDPARRAYVLHDKFEVMLIRTGHSKAINERVPDWTNVADRARALLVELGTQQIKGGPWASLNLANEQTFNALGGGTSIA